MLDVWYPGAYAKPHQEFVYPDDYQQRLEEGLAVLLPKLPPGVQAHLKERMRRNGCASAEEELLLARGFSRVFGEPAISYPAVAKDQAVPEFHVQVSGKTVEIEAKGLFDPDVVRRLNEAMRRSGQNSWYSFNPKIGDVARLDRTITEALLSPATGHARIVVLTKYEPWISPFESVPLIRTLAVNPGVFGIPIQNHPLAIAYVTTRRIAGVWFNRGVERRVALDAPARESIRVALKASFYARRDGVFFDEHQDEDTQREMISKMERRRGGAGSSNLGD